MKLFLNWQTAQQRLQAAQQTLAGAGADALAKEAEFKGVAKWLYGDDFTFEFVNGKLIFHAPSETTKAGGKNAEANGREIKPIDLRKLTKAVAKTKR